MIRPITLGFVLLVFGVLAGCGGDASKGVNSGLDRPKAPAKTGDAKVPAEK